MVSPGVASHPVTARRVRLASFHTSKTVRARPASVYPTIFQARLLAEYTNRNLSAAEITAELVATARTSVPTPARRAVHAIPDAHELAFHDAVAHNESAVSEVGTDVLADVTHDLVNSLRRDVTADWVSREDVRARLRTTIKRLLAKHGYPPDAQPTAIQLVLAQMETFRRGVLDRDGSLSGRRQRRVVAAVAGGPLPSAR